VMSKGCLAPFGKECATLTVLRTEVATFAPPSMARTDSRSEQMTKRVEASIDDDARQFLRHHDEPEESRMQ
jgi:hypothetical protein